MGKLMAFFAALLVATTANAFAPRAHGAARRAVITASATDRIQSLVDENKIMLFMKGTKMFPQCGCALLALFAGPC